MRTCVCVYLPCMDFAHARVSTDRITGPHALCPCMHGKQGQGARGRHDQGTLVPRKRQTLGLRSIRNIRKPRALRGCEELSALWRHACTGALWRHACANPGGESSHRFQTYTGVGAGALGIAAGTLLSPLLLSAGLNPLVTVASTGLMVMYTSSSTAAQYLILGRLQVTLDHNRPAFASPFARGFQPCFPGVWHGFWCPCVLVSRTPAP